MPTVIDSLFVELGLDSKHYETNQKKATESLGRFKKNTEDTTKSVQMQTKSMTEGFASVKAEIISLAAAAIGASSVKSFFTSMVGNEAQLGRTAEFLGMTAKQIDVVGKMMESVGGKKESFAQGMQAIVGGLARFSMTGDYAGIAVFKQLGISTDKMTTDKIGALADLADKFKTMSPQGSLMAGDKLGINLDMVNLLRKGGDSFRKQYSEYEKLSDVTKKSVAESQQAQEEWAKVKAQFNGIAQSIFNDMLPALKQLNVMLVEFSAWVGSHKTEISGFFSGLSDAIVILANGFERLDKATDGWSTKIIAVIAAVMAGKGALGLLGRVAGIIGGSSAAGVAVAATGPGMLARVGMAATSTAGVALAGIGALLYSGTSDNGEDAIVAKRNKKSDAANGNRFSTIEKKYGLPDSTSSTNSMFARLEKKYGLPAGLLDSIWAQESSRGKNMLSSAGAMGHFGIMPKTATELGITAAQTGDLDVSANATAKKMAGLMKYYHGNMYNAISAYHAGEGNWDSGRNIGPASMAYAPSVMSRMNSSKAGGSTSEVNIQTINIHTQAQDADAMARDVGPALKRNNLIYSSATGQR